jgi:hypothetical protein
MNAYYLLCLIPLCFFYLLIWSLCRASALADKLEIRHLNDRL